MRLSQETNNALGVLTYLAQQPSEYIGAAADLAQTLDLPLPFLSKILQRLSRAGIVRGFRGRVRGYGLAHAANQISVRSVVTALEGEDLFDRCIFWSRECSEKHSCPLHEEWATIRPQLSSRLAKLTLAQLARRHDPISTKRRKR